MANKNRPKIYGLDVLGSRLRDMRLKAGISQMKLAESLGLNPTHGYKYILRLEKGLVPNPTLRTITTYLAACGASWQDIADILPNIGVGPAPAQTEKTEPSEPVIIPPSLPENQARKLPALGLTDKGIQTKEFWQLVQKVQADASEYLRLLNLSTTSRRLLHSFIRSVCTCLALIPADAVEPQISRLLKTGIKQGLDEKILSRVLNICLEVFAPGQHREGK